LTTTNYSLGFKVFQRFKSETFTQKQAPFEIFRIS
jgi:hypothetical protein